MEKSLEKLSEDLKIASEYCCKQAELSIGMGEIESAVYYLSRGTQYRYYLNSIHNPTKSNCSLVRTAIIDTLAEAKQWKTNLGKTIVHSLNPGAAEQKIGSLLTGNNQLFWQAYFYAEHWQNQSATPLFAKLAQEEPTALNIHWYGNVLSKQGRFLEARQPLETAARMEPGRYNHHSHLGNVYRALGMKKESKVAYMKALKLISAKKEIGRVEYLHMVRCYNGLFQLGEKDFGELETQTTKLAVCSGEVAPNELERIKF